MELIALCCLVALLQIVAIGSDTPATFRYMRLGMPLLAALIAYQAVAADVAAPWIGFMALVGVIFFAAPELPRLLWVPINIGVATVCLALAGHLTLTMFGFAQ